MDTESCTVLVGIGTDGASANIAKGGLKALVVSKCEWQPMVTCQMSARLCGFCGYSNTLCNIFEGDAIR